jgi:hypothetical protein
VGNRPKGSSSFLLARDPVGNAPIVLFWAFPEVCLLLCQPEVGKVTLKSNGDEALSDEFLLKSNSNEALNDVFL